jgi:hypothetical protein
MFLTAHHVRFEANFNSIIACEELSDAKWRPGSVEVSNAFQFTNLTPSLAFLPKKPEVHTQLARQFF